MGKSESEACLYCEEKNMWKYIHYLIVHQSFNCGVTLKNGEKRYSPSLQNVWMIDYPKSSSIINAIILHTQKNNIHE